MTLRKPLVAFLLVSALAAAPVAFAQQGKVGKGKGTGSAASAGATGSSLAATPGGSAAVPVVSSAGAAASAGVAVGAPVSNNTSGVLPVAATTPVPAGSVDGQTYAVRLRDLEQRVDELKEQIRRSHTRLSLLSDSVLSGGVSGSRADIAFQNEMSTAFKLTRALFVLDGAVQYNKSDESGALSDQPSIPIFSGSIPPGDHTLQVLVRLQGNGYGVFSYLKGYNFEVRSTHSFTATEGKTISLNVVAYEKGGVTTPLEERPAVRFLEKVASGIQGPLPAAPAAPGPASPAAPRATATGGFSTGVSVGAGVK